MVRKSKWLLLLLSLVALVAAAACGGDDDDAATATTPSGAGTTTTTRGPAKKVELINVSYDPTRELYEQYAKLFHDYYLEKANVDVTVSNSHGGSGSQARAIVDGLEADVATLALSGDTDRVVTAGLIQPGWQSEFKDNSNPYVSTIVLLVRKGNPKGVKDWSDLAKDGVGVITPNPKTSGGARWNFLAAWGSVTFNGGSEAQARETLGKIFKNVKVLDSGARGSTQTFVDRGIGDVLISWENEALLTLRDSKDFEIVYPKQSILAEPSVAIVDKNVDKKGTRDVATEFLNYLYSDAAQELIAKNYYRPGNPTILARYKTQYPEFQRLFTIRDFDSWDAVQKKFFADGAIFDQIYRP